MSVTIKRTEGLQLTVKASRFKALSSSKHGCYNREDGYSYPECVIKWARKEYVEIFKRKGKKGNNLDGIDAA